MNCQTKKHEVPELVTLPLRHLPDNELLVLFVDHQSEAAFNELVGRHSAMVLSVCLSVVSDRNRADDAFQITFLTLIRNARKLKTIMSFGGWLNRVAYHSAIKVLKSARTELNQVEFAEPLIEIDPLNRLAAREIVQSVVCELQFIPERYREVITLYYLEQLSRNEIAERLDCKCGND